MFNKLKLIKLSLGISTVLASVACSVGGYYLFTSSWNSSRFLDKYYINPIVNSPNGFVTAYRSAVIRGAEVIVCPGFNHKDPIESAFNQSDRFNDTGFLLLDNTVSSTSRAAPNTWSITFRTDLGSIKVGIAIAYFLNYYQDVFADDGNLTWATWGGQPFSSVTSFMGGIQKGIEWANSKLSGKTINGNQYKNVEQVFSDKGEFTGGFGPGNGTDLITSLVFKKPDIIIPVAGPQIWTAQTEIEKLGNSKTLLIGVDSAVENDPQNRPIKFKDKNGNLIGNGKRIQFSSLKDLSRASEIALEIINNGNKVPEQKLRDPNRYKNFSETGATGEVAGLGTVAIGDTVNGCVGISSEGQKYLDDALNLIKNSGGQVDYINDPSLDPQYSNPDNMYYQGKTEKYNYGDVKNFGLSQKFAVNNEYKEDNKVLDNLNLKDFIGNGKSQDDEKIKIVLSSPEAILMDSSFAQSCYTGLYYYYKSMGISIPAPKGVQRGR